MNRSCKVAVVGAGSMAREHIKAFRDVPGVTVAGITSRSRSKAEALAQEFGVGLVCDSIDELFEKTHADLVVVTVFELAMQGVAEKCFTFPWAVLLEKPAGYTVPIAEQIAAAQKPGQKVYVALNRRMHSSTRNALARLNEIEGQRYIRVQDQQDLEVARSLGHPAAVVENWMYANSIHVIDYLRVFGRGKIKKVEPIVRWNPSMPGVVLAEVTFDSGDIGLYEGIWNGPGPWAVNIMTPAERLEIRPLEQLTYQLRGERKLNPVEVDKWDTQYKAGFRLQAEQAIAAVRGELSDLATLDDSLETMRLIRAIFKTYGPEVS